MATKAERFRQVTERSAQKRHSQLESTKGSTESRPLPRKAAPSASYALEDSQSDRPSRKSTRKSENRQKPDSALKNRQTMATTSPKARAERAKARSKR